MTMRHASKPPLPHYRLLIDGGRVLLQDLRATAPDETSAPAIDATRHFYRAPRGRFMRIEVPTVRLTWPSGKRIVIGVWDPALRWAGSVRRLRKLDYIIGREEWRRLRAALKLV